MHISGLSNPEGQREGEYTEYRIEKENIIGEDICPNGYVEAIFRHKTRQEMGDWIPEKNEKSAPYDVYLHRFT